MLNAPAKLRERSEPIRVGVIGAGLFGGNLIDQIEHVAGMTTAAVADIDTQRAESALATAGVDEGDITVVSGADDAATAIEDHRRVVFADGRELTASPVDVVVEATGVPNAGAHTRIVHSRTGSTS